MARQLAAALMVMMAVATAMLATNSGAHAARPPSSFGRRAIVREGEGGAVGWAASVLQKLGSWSPSSSTRAATRVGPSTADDCETGEVRKGGLKALKEVPFIGLFEDLKGVNKFEASGMTSARGRLWIVFDNIHAIGRVDEHFQFRSPNNALVGALGDDSQFEGLSYDDKTGHFYAVEEVVEAGDSHLHPYAREIAVDERAGTYRTVNRCPVHYQLTHTNKGFEGLHFYRDPKDPNRQLLLGLCEGNYCRGGRRGADRGNGRIVVSQLSRNGTDCAWEVVKMVDVPSAANFMDYSGMDFNADGRVAITSQEDSAVFVGQFDWEALEFSDGGTGGPDARVYYFPRNEHCEMIYCNVEGVSWLDDSRLIVASDKAKSDQPYVCTEHDQSIAIFALPQ